MPTPEPANPDRGPRHSTPSAKRALGLAAILLVHIALAGSFARTVPPFNWPDEPAHFNYVRQLAAGEGLPAMDRPSWSPLRLEELKRRHFEDVDPFGEEIAEIRYEAHQPPLYYVLAAGVFRLTTEALRLDALRAVNLALSSAVLLLTFAVGRRLFPATPAIAWTAALFSAVVPMRCFMAVSIGNGVAAELVLATFLLAMVAGARPLVIGSILGLGLWVHAATLLGPLLYAAWLWLGPTPDASKSESAGRSASRLRAWATATALALALASPWMLRNTDLYGWTDPFALGSGALGSAAAETEAVGTARPTLELLGAYGLASFGRLTFASFWGVFGWMEMFYGRAFQALFLLLAAAALLGLARFALEKPAAGERTARRTRQEVAALALFPLLVGAALVGYSTVDFQPQGRYLNLVSPALALLYAVGLRVLLGRRLSAWPAPITAGLGAISLYGALYVVPWYLAR